MTKALAFLAGLGLGVLIARLPMLTWKSEIDVLAFFSVIVNLALVFVVHTLLRRRQTRDKYALDALTDEASAIVQRVVDLHRRFRDSGSSPLDNDACQLWLLGHREVSNRLGHLRSESEAWAMPAEALERCEEAQAAWTRYKQVTTSEGFPPNRGFKFILSKEKLDPADRELQALKDRVGAYRRAIVS